MLRAHRLLPLLALLPAPLFAQAAAFSSANFADGTKTKTVNLADCTDGTVYTVQWTLDATPVSGQTVELRKSTSETCTAGSGDLLKTAQAQTTSANGSTTLGAGDLVSDCADVEETIYLCLELTGSGLDTNPTTSLTFTVDTTPPAPPDEVSATGGDASVTVSWSYAGITRPSDISAFRVAYREASSTADPSYAPETNASPARVSGLVNGTEYEVWVEARDEAGNWGDASPSATASARPSNDFWESYLAAGGSQTGGCSSASGFGLPGLLLVGLALVLVRRRRALTLGALAVAVFLLAPAPARAQGWVDPERAWFFEAHLGPYRPNVDSEFGGSGPYAEIFGEKSPLLAGLRVERTIWQGIGEVGIGVGASFGQAAGKSLYADGTKSPDTTVFNWVPLDLTATYRFDYAAQHWNVPLALFARAGVVYDLWWILDGNGAIATGPSGQDARGGRWGYRYGGGVMLLLDFIDPRLAKDFERSSGVDNTYLYFEYGRMQIDGFGSSGFDLSDTTWTAGLAVEF